MKQECSYPKPNYYSEYYSHSDPIRSGIIISPYRCSICNIHHNSNNPIRCYIWKLLQITHILMSRLNQLFCITMKTHNSISIYSKTQSSCLFSFCAYLELTNIKHYILWVFLFHRIHGNYCWKLIQLKLKLCVFTKLTLCWLWAINNFSLLPYFCELTIFCTKDRQGVFIT